MSEQQVETPRSFEEVYADLCRKFEVQSIGIDVGEVGVSLGAPEKPYTTAYHGRNPEGRPTQVVFTLQQSVWEGFVNVHSSYADTWDAAQRFLAEKESIPVIKEGR